MASMPQAARDGAEQTSADPVGSADFGFLPKTLTAKCRHLIETYHGINGYACLPDMLWHPEVRNFIEMRKDFSQIFKKASTTRSAKRANESYMLIATTILAIEVLASGFASWGSRFPAAKRRAHMLLGQYTLSARTCLMDRYLYPRSYINPAFINALSPSESPGRVGGLHDSSRARLVDVASAEARSVDPPGGLRKLGRDLVEPLEVSDPV